MLNLSFMHIKYILYFILGFVLYTSSLSARAHPADGVVQPQAAGMSITSAPKQVPIGWTDITFNVTYPSRISGCSVYGSGSFPDSSVWVYWRKKGATGTWTPAWAYVNNRTEFLRFYSCGGPSRTLNASLAPEMMLWGSPQEPGDYEFAVALAWQLSNNGTIYEDYSNIVTISIGKSNTAPSVSNIDLVTAEDTTGTITLPIFDPDDDSHVFKIIENPSVGSAWISGNILNFSPPTNWNGQTSIVFQATDPKGAVSNPGLVSVTVTPVNDPPVAIAKTLTIDEDTIGTIKLSATDIDSPPPSTFQIVTSPSPGQGIASISGNTLTFIPTRDWNGTSTLTYRAQDDAGAWSVPVTVTIQVNPVNDTPVVSAVQLVTAEDTPGAITLSAADIDSTPPFNFAIVDQSPTQHGIGSIRGNVLTFTPFKDWNGTTTLTYRAQDNAGAWSAPATVTIQVNPVNDIPVVSAVNLVTPEDTPGAITLSAADIDSTPPFIFEIVAQPPAKYGTGSLRGNVLTFTPFKDWNGTTTLTYRAQDNAGAWSAPATVTLQVTPVNDPPVVSDAALTIDEDTVGNHVLTAYDPDIGDKFIFEIVAPPAAAHGSVSIKQGNTLEFVPSKDWFGVTTFSYRARDLAGDISNTATVTITVNPVNDIPVVSAVNMVTSEDTPGAITLSAADIDSTPPFNFEIVGQPPAKYGIGNIAGDVLTFTPFKDWNGTTSLIYRAQDKEGGWSLPATVRITVNPVNDVPALRVPLKIQTRENVPVTVKAAITKQ